MSTKGKKKGSGTQLSREIRCYLHLRSTVGMGTIDVVLCNCPAGRKIQSWTSNLIPSPHRNFLLMLSLYASASHSPSLLHMDRMALLLQRLSFLLFPLLCCQSQNGCSGWLAVLLFRTTRVLLSTLSPSLFSLPRRSIYVLFICCDFLADRYFINWYKTNNSLL